MRTIKKYANGQFFDTTNKKYIKKEELLKLLSGRSKVKVILSKTGEDITASLTPKKKAAKPKKRAVSPSKLPSARQMSENVKRWATENRKWISDQVDTSVKSMLKVMNLPTRAQVAKLTTSVRDLDKKVKQLEKLQAQNLQKMEKAQEKKMQTLARQQDQRLKKLETDNK